MRATIRLLVIVVLVVLALWSGYFAALHAWLTAVPPSSDVPVHQAWTGVSCVLSGLFLIAAGVIAWTFRRRYSTPIPCSKCGYDLTGNTTGVCPECGSKPP